MSLSRLKDNIDFIVKNRDEIALSVVDEESIEVLQNRLEQGKKADGDSFPEYSPTTLGIKRATGGFISPSGNIAWKDTGDFYRSMKLKKGNGFLEIDSDDENAAKIFQRAPTVLDISRRENNEIFDNKRVEMINEYRKRLLG